MAAAVRVVAVARVVGVVRAVEAVLEVAVEVVVVPEAEVAHEPGKITRMPYISMNRQLPVKGFCLFLFRILKQSCSGKECLATTWYFFVIKIVSPVIIKKITANCIIYGQVRSVAVR